jgi:RNA polymerase sigma-70 factor, ECF subfamily
MTIICKDKIDGELVELSLKDKEYFLCIIKKYHDKLFRYIRRISGVSHEDIEDVLQDVFIKVYIHLYSYDNKQSFSSWIYRIARNETISAFRKKKARPQVKYLESEEFERIAGIIDLEKEKDQMFLKEHIEKSLNKLDTKYRDVLVLKYLEDKDYKEIADILHKPMGTVATLLNRAKKKFKKISNVNL